MAGKTISEKILSAKSGCDARAGDVVICRIDAAMATDGSAPLAIEYFEQMQGKTVTTPDRLSFFIDHYPAAGHPESARHHDRMRAFARRHGIRVYEAGEGVCHQLMAESGNTRPGDLVVGGDSHSVTGGALNAFATGIGSSDLAAAMICGRIWLRTPETIQVILDGTRGSYLDAKDIALALVGSIGAHGAVYQTLEFSGPAASELDLESRMVLSNFSVEMGAKAGIFPADAHTSGYLQGRTSAPIHPVAADPDAVYARSVRLDLSGLGPMIALPHAVDRVVEVGRAAGTPIRMVYLGTCTGGRIGDFHCALRVLEAGGGIAAGVTLLFSPASKEIEALLTRDGTLGRLRSLGAQLIPPGCGSCCGTDGPVPADGVNVMSSANRNFKGRMGNVRASIYLGSPASCAAAAATGRITDPRTVLGGGR